MPEFVSQIPPQLRESLLHGKAAAEIGWGSHGDFDRCVAFLERHGVPARMRKGECNTLHKAATGKYPAQGHAGDTETFADVDMGALVASMGTYDAVRWRGPLAPIGKPTGDRRIFPPDTLTYQTFPAPLRWQEHGMPGHEDAVVVGSITHAAEGMWQGAPHIVGEGYFLNPDIIPDVTKAIHLVENGVSGPSVDLDTFTGASVTHQGRSMLAVVEGRVRGATLVSIPAFADLRLELQYPEAVDETVDQETMEAPVPMPLVESLIEPDVSIEDPLGDAMVASVQEFASVNASGWKGAPIAPRDAEFDADEAVSRIEQYAGVGTDSPDESKMRKMFLWVDPQGTPLDRAGYRLPWGDIIDGKPYLIYHAIYAAAALLEGGHGGLPNIPDSDKARLRSVISNIYAKLAVEYGDPQIQASWDRAADKAQKATKAEAMDIETFAVRTSGWSSLPTSTAPWDEGAARAALNAWAGDDMAKYGRAFLWSDGSGNKTGFKLPIAKPVNGKLTIFISAVNAADSRLNQTDIPAADKAKIQGILNRIQARYKEAGLVASGYDGIHPPRSAFAQRNLGRKTKMTVVPRDGYNEVYGHLADWDTCHLGLQIGRPNVCVKPPRSKRGYVDFHISSILTAEGDLLDVGKLTIDAYHGSTRQGITAAQVRAHYEHTGTEAAVGRVYEDEFGPAFFGVQVPDANPALAQKIRRTPASGHWHPINGHLELVAALGVNRPAYPIVASMEDGDMVDNGSIVFFDEGEQTGLIAGVTFTPEELAVQEAEEVPLGDCGCGEPTERDARLSGYALLPTRAELQARRARLGAHLI